MSKRLVLTFVSLFIMCVAVMQAEAQQTDFSYQGKLTDNGSPANGNYDLQFDLWDAPTGGNQVSPKKTLANIPVTNGVFTVTVDFGAGIFNGGLKFMEVAARPSGTGPYTVLSPRQQITSTPYAVRSLNTATADLATNAQQLAGVAATEYVRNSDARLSDARTPTAGSSNYVQNSSSPQAAANFNISGNGTAGGTLSANQVNANTQYNLNGNRAFAINGAGQWTNSNTFVGVGAGALTTPSSNTDSGSNNSFFGFGSGAANTTGFSNSFFGMNAGKANTTGEGNSFFGRQAGFGNTTGEINSFFGDWAGLSNTTGNLNSFFGHRAGWHNTSGSNNVILGYDAGQTNTTGNSNSFLGTAAGWSNVTGSSNTYLGTIADGSADINNSTAVGARAKVTQSNSLVLGSISGINGATADTKVGIGTTAPTFKLHVVDPANTGLRVQTNAAGGTVASFGGLGDFSIDSNGQSAGRFVVKENGNTGIGTIAPQAKLDVNGKLRVQSLGFAGNVQLCLNSSAEIASCSSSLRYKTNLRPYTSGLNLINRLQPLSFTWKSDQSRDLGLAAEEVAAIDPLLVTRNANGEVEGVKYDRLAVVLINAVKEQQAQLKEQQSQIERQQAEIDELKQLVRKPKRNARTRK
jgi:endosialidase-like protein